MFKNSKIDINNLSEDTKLLIIIFGFILFGGLSFGIIK